MCFSQVTVHSIGYTHQVNIESFPGKCALDGSVNCFYLLFRRIVVFEAETTPKISLSPIFVCYRLVPISGNCNVCCMHAHHETLMDFCRYHVSALKDLCFCCYCNLGQVLSEKYLTKILCAGSSWSKIELRSLHLVLLPISTHLFIPM